jgi:trimethylamine--corrinoid protein Co-methyltransferase
LPYGRPEVFLCSAAISQIARHLGALDEGSVGRGTTAKAADVECGLNKGFEAGMELALLGKVSWHFGIFSIDEVYDPALMVIENEFLESMKRVARGFEVNENTLAFDVIKEVGIGGQFLGHPHTHENFRQELWLPEFFNGAIYESWRGAGGKAILDRARERILAILATHHPRGIREQTEQALLTLLEKYARTLGLPAAKPSLPA